MYKVLENKRISPNSYLIKIENSIINKRFIPGQFVIVMANSYSERIPLTIYDCNDNSYYAFEILYWCGIREGELLALTPADFDFEKSTLRINKSYQRMHGEDVVTTPKTKKSNRVIKLPKFQCEEMKDCLKMFYDIKPGDRIFQSLSKHVLSTEMERGCKAAGVKVIRIHDLRHSHVSFLINKGFTALEIGNRVGHETERITYRYAHLFPTKQDEMADFLDNERFSNDTEKEA